MRPKFLMLSGVTKRDRHQVISDMNEMIVSAGGWVIDHMLFSNTVATLRFSVPAEAFQAVTKKAKAAGVSLDAEGLSAINELAANTGNTDADITATLNITFVHDEPDLRRHIPAVPG